MAFALAVVVVMNRTKVAPSSRRTSPRQGVVPGKVEVHVPDTFVPAPEPVALYRPPPLAEVLSSHAHTVCPLSKAKPYREARAKKSEGTRPAPDAEDTPLYTFSPTFGAEPELAMSCDWSKLKPTTRRFVAPALAV